MKFARFMSNSPFCVTIDDKYCPKLWNFITLQLL